MRKFVMSFALLVLLASTAYGTQLFFKVLSVPTAGPGAPLAVGNMDRKTVSLEGSWAGSYQVQISLEQTGADGGTTVTPWQNEGSALTARGTVEITKPCAWVRVVATTVDGGAPVGRVAGVAR